MLITNLISRYMKLCKAAFSAGDGAKLNKSIQTNVMEMLFLLMVTPRKCNFTQMGRYGKRGEQCYRQTAERSVNWLEMNMWLSAFAFKQGKCRNAIVIDPSFIKKAGKHTPYVGTFWSGCAGAVKHGLEILGIGVIDMDLHECMMLKAVQTTLEKGEEKKEMSLYDWYAKVLEDDKVTLQRICKVLVADSAFSKRPFIDKVMKMGFHVVSRLRHDAASKRSFAFATQSSSSVLPIVRHATRENLTLPSTLHSRHSMWPKSCARNLARPSVDLKRRWSMPTMRNELLTCSRRTRTRH